MRLVPALVFAVLVAAATAQDALNDGDKFNSIDTKPSVRLDPYIRKALLKALSELEENDEQTTSADIVDSTGTLNTELLTPGEDVTEALAPAKEGIQIHSFIVNGQSAFTNNSNTTPTFIDEKISILSTTTGNVDQVTTTLPTQSPFNEIFQTKESSVNVQQVRSIQTTSNKAADNSIVTKKPVPSTTTTTPTTTTTTTTPKPTHNDDGENIEEVDKRDVQVFQAPLVAAFTVHQDAQGLPNKVIPIFQNPNIPNSKPQASTIVPTGLPPPQSTPITTISNSASQNSFISQQLALQKQLEEKQRILEEQLRLLQIQQRQQEELLRKQQFLLQQKEAQRQQQLLFEQRQQFQEQQRLQSNQAVNGFNGLHKNIQQNQFSIQNNGLRPSPQVTIQQSVPIALDQRTSIGNQQQLPNREAVDFLIHLRSQQSEQFPLQDNHVPQGISNFLQPSFNQLPNFNQIRAEDQFRPKQANRVFRQESGVGNFGLNNQNYNRFNTFNPVVSNRFFPNNRINQFNPDSELKQLLVQNGLSGRSHEDLNIVSKVLSLNHGLTLNNNLSNRLPFDSRRHVRPLL